MRSVEQLLATVRVELDDADMVYVKAVATAAGLVLVTVLIRRWRRASHARSLTQREQEMARKLHAEALERVRNAKGIGGAGKGIPDFVEEACSSSEGFYALLRNLQSGQISASDALYAFMRKALQVDSNLNCVCYPLAECFDQAELADQQRHILTTVPALHGLPVSIKNCLQVKGYPSSIGIPTWAATIHNESCVNYQVLREAGAIPFVVTNVPQTMMSYECSNPIHGETNNPHRKDRIPGGSSGGEACIHGAFGAPAGVGSDIGGSVRIPAHCCGTVGLKPTMHRISLKGMTTSLPGQSAVSATAGPMAPTVAGCAELFRALTSPRVFELDTSLPPLEFNEDLYSTKRRLRIGFFTGKEDSILDPTPACQRAVREAADILRRAGHDVVEFQPPRLRYANLLYFRLLGGDGGDTLLDIIKGSQEDKRVRPLYFLARLPQSIKWLLNWFSLESLPVPLALLASVLRQPIFKAWKLQAAKKDYYFEFDTAMRTAGCDILICPAHVMPAARAGTTATLSAACWPTMLYNLLDMPAGVVRVTHVTRRDDELLEKEYKRQSILHRMVYSACSDSEGLPLGVQVVGRRWQEELVLNVMHTLEEHR